MKTLDTLARRIRVQLRAQRMTQAELAKKANITEAGISRYVNGVRSPKADQIVQLAKALGVSSDYLLGLSESRSEVIQCWQCRHRDGDGICHAFLNIPMKMFDDDYCSNAKRKKRRKR